MGPPGMARPLPAAVVTSAIALALASAVQGRGPSQAAVLGWVLGVAGLMAARGLLDRRHPRTAAAGRRAPSRGADALTVLEGTVFGLAAPLFFPALPLESLTLVSLLMVGWTLGAGPAGAAAPRAVGLRVAPVLLQLAGSWALLADGAAFAPSRLPGGPLVALAVTALLALELRAAADGARTVRDAIATGAARRGDAPGRRRAATDRGPPRDRPAGQAGAHRLAAAGHDLRQPLQAVTMLSAALSMRARDPGSRELADGIAAGVRSLGSMIDGLIDLSRLDAGVIQADPTIFMLESSLRAVAASAATAAEGRGQRLEVRAEPGLWGRTDRALLEQVLRRLLVHALRHAADGHLVLACRAAGADAVELSIGPPGVTPPSTRPGRGACDTPDGHGPGADLGLAVAERLADLLDLPLGLDASPDRGAACALQVPRAAAPMRPEPLDRPPADAHTGTGCLPVGLRVLVVDDDPALRAGMTGLCAGWGVEADIADGLESALACADRARPHVLITDYRLRGPATGVDLVRALRARQPDLPAIVLTGDPSPERRRATASLGVALLPKPARPDALRRALVAAIDGGRL